MYQAFNQSAYNKRVENSYQNSADKIAEAWGNGVPFVDLELEEDLFKPVKKRLLDNVTGLSLVYNLPKGGNSKKKGTKIVFRVAHQDMVASL